MFYLRTEDPPKYQDDVRKAILATPGMSTYDVRPPRSISPPSRPIAFPASTSASSRHRHRRRHRLPRHLPVHVHRRHGAHPRDRHPQIHGRLTLLHRRHRPPRNQRPGSVGIVLGIAASFLSAPPSRLAFPPWTSSLTFPMSGRPSSSPSSALSSEPSTQPSKPPAKILSTPSRTSSPICPSAGKRNKHQRQCPRQYKCGPSHTSVILWNSCHRLAFNLCTTP